MTVAVIQVLQSCLLRRYCPPAEYLRKLPFLASLERSCRSPGTMVVYIQPLAITAMPDTGLFGLHGARPALAINILGQTDIGNTSCIITNDMNMGIQDGSVDWFAVLRQ
uniref:Uncharacterized protein n=1 Tax=Micrurus corallinus TaxID=54390 RepID=A0A2D4FMP6_MICCO